MKFKPFTVRILTFLLLTIFVLLCYLSQSKKSVTIDEFSHFPSGVYNLLTMDWRMDKESPPLVKCLPAITSIITKPKLDISLFKEKPNPWTLGYHFMYANQSNYQKIFIYGRCVIILLGCLLGWLLYKFSTEIYGQSSSIFVLYLYVFNPNILAHSSLATIDIGASLIIFLSIFCLWKYLQKRCLASVFLCGLSLGLAQLSKFTALLLYPIFTVIIVISGLVKYLSKNDTTHYLKIRFVMKDLGNLFIIFCVSIIIINAGYLFSGSFTPMGEFDFLSIGLKNISYIMGESPLIPLPYEYLTGLDSQLAISEGENPFYISYLMGDHSMEGWWYYYIVAFFVKNPLVLIVIISLGIAAWLMRKPKNIDLDTMLCIWMPPLIFLVYFSFFVHIQIGIRYLLPIFPFLFLSVGILISSKFFKNRTSIFLFSLFLTAYAVTPIKVFPNYLSYFNLAAGGPENGRYWLNDSNLDWGQDLTALKKYMDRNGIDKIKLGYFGRVDPGIYGIDYTLSENNITQGIHAISVNFLTGKSYYLLKPNAQGLVYADLYYYKKFWELKPVDIINNTIYIFRKKSVEY